MLLSNQIFEVEKHKCNGGGNRYRVARSNIQQISFIPQHLSFRLMLFHLRNVTIICMQLQPSISRNLWSQAPNWLIEPFIIDVTSVVVVLNNDRDHTSGKD